MESPCFDVVRLLESLTMEIDVMNKQGRAKKATLGQNVRYLYRIVFL